MKQICFRAFRLLVIIILIAKISNWVLQYSPETNKVINAAMFILIGLAYIVAGFIWNKKMTNMLFLFSGVYLIAMNFIPDFSLKHIIGIICIVTPLLIVYFFPENDDKKELIKQN